MAPNRATQMTIKKIMCPVCEFQFGAEPDSEGHCECPNCQSVLMIEGATPQYDFVTNFEECAIESWQVSQEVKILDDVSLEDEISEVVATRDFMQGTFAIFTDMDFYKNMSEPSRKLAEGVYILIHSQKYFGYNH